MIFNLAFNSACSNAYPASAGGYCSTCGIHCAYTIWRVGGPPGACSAYIVYSSRKNAYRKNACPVQTGGCCNTCGIQRACTIPMDAVDDISRNACSAYIGGNVTGRCSTSTSISSNSAASAFALYTLSSCATRWIVPASASMVSRCCAIDFASLTGSTGSIRSQVTNACIACIVAVRCPRE